MIVLQIGAWHVNGFDFRIAATKHKHFPSVCTAGYHHNRLCQRANCCDDNSGGGCRTHLSQQYVAVVQVADLHCLWDAAGIECMNSLCLANWHCFWVTTTKSMGRKVALNAAQCGSDLSKVSQNRWCIRSRIWRATTCSLLAHHSCTIALAASSAHIDFSIRWHLGLWFAPAWARLNLCSWTNRD